MSEHCRPSTRAVVWLLVFLVTAAPLVFGGSAVAVDTPTVTVEDRVFEPGEEATLDVVLSSTPSDLAGYAIEVEVADDAAVDVVDASAPELARSDATIDGNTVTFVAADLDDDIEAGTQDVQLGSITVEAPDNGPVDTVLSVDVIRLDAVDGDPINPAVEPGQVLVTSGSQVTVSPDGSGDFDSVETAVDAVPDGAVVLVESATYEESIEVDKNITVSGSGATLDGSNTSTGAAITIGPNATPTINGFTLKEWDVGIDAANTSGDWQAADLTITDTGVGVLAGSNTVESPVGLAPGAAGNWTVTNVSINEPDSYGILADSTTGDWAVVDSTAEGGLSADQTDGAWTVTGGTISNSAATSDGLAAVSAEESTGEWTIVDTTVVGDNVNARHASGDWMLQNVTVRSAVRTPRPTDEQAGVTAAETSGNWSITESRLVATGGSGVYATSTSGDWTIDQTLIAANDGPGIVARYPFANTIRISNSAFVRNDGADIDARGADDIDTTGNWWAAEPDDRCIGIACDAARPNPPVPTPTTHVVAPGASGDYSSLDTALDAADHGDLIVVANGTYEAPVRIDRAVDIVARNAGGAVLNGSRTSVSTAIQIDPAATVAPTVDGFDITDFETGVDASGARGAWTLRNLTVEGTEVGVDAAGTTGGWFVQGAIVRSNQLGIRATDAGDAVFPVEIRDSQVRENTGVGIDATDADTEVDARRNWWGQADGPQPNQCVGNIDCTDHLTTPDADGITIRVAADGSADFRTIDGAVSAAEDGDRVVVEPGEYSSGIEIESDITLTAAESGEAVIVGGPPGERLRIGNNAAPVIEGFQFVSSGSTDLTATVPIGAPGTAGDWTLRNVTIAESDTAVDAARASGNWTIENSVIKGQRFIPILAGRTTGDWTVADTIIQSGRDDEQAPAGSAIQASGSTGNWSVRTTQITGDRTGIDAVDTTGGLIVDSVITDNTGIGIDAPDSTGLTVRRTRVADNGDTGLNARDATGPVSINGSIISNNGGAGINATGAVVTVDATMNWWGQADGPAPGQCVGNVDCASPLADAPTISGPTLQDDIVVAPDGSGDFESIQEAIDAAADGDTIRIRDGTYPETLIVDKNVTLLGSGEVVLEGPGSDADVPSAIFITADAAPTIANLTLREFPVGVDAFDSGNWTMRDTTIAETDLGVIVEESGAWRVDNSTIVRNNKGFIVGTAGSVPDMSGRIARSTITNNSEVGIDATDANRTIDATDNWWGQEDGPTADQCVGNVDCSEPLPSPPSEEVTITVAADGSGDYETIGAAVADASEGETVRVRNGTYSEERIVLNKTITIVGDANATLVGPGPDSGEFTTRPAFRVPSNLDSAVAPTIRGLTLRNYVTGFRFYRTSGDWTVRNVTIEHTRLAMTAARSEGDWVVRDVTHRPPETSSFSVGIDAERSSGQWRIDGFDVARVNASVTADRASGDWTVTNGQFVDTGVGVVASEATGAWRVTDTAIEANPSYEWASEIAGVEADGTTRAWRITDVSIIGADTAIDVSADDRFETSASGDWVVRRSVFINNELAIDAQNTTGAWEVTSSITTDNELGIDAIGAAVTGNATRNWWGQEDGPTADQCFGNVDCSEPLASEPDDAGP